MRQWHITLDRLIKATQLGQEAEPVVFSLLARSELRLADLDQKLDGDALLSMGEVHLRQDPKMTRCEPGHTVKNLARFPEGIFPNS